jgi:hypothetical protein
MLQVPFREVIVIIRAPTWFGFPLFIFVLIADFRLVDMLFPISQSMRNSSSLRESSRSSSSVITTPKEVWGTLNAACGFTLNAVCFQAS